MTAYICTHTCTLECTHTHMHTHTCTLQHEHTRVYAHAHSNTIHTRAHTYTHLNSSTHAHTRTPTNMHTCIYTHSNKNLRHGCEDLRRWYGQQRAGSWHKHHLVRTGQRLLHHSPVPWSSDPQQLRILGPCHPPLNSDGV